MIKKIVKIVQIIILTILLIIFSQIDSYALTRDDRPTLKKGDKFKIVNNSYEYKNNGVAWTKNYKEDKIGTQVKFTIEPKVENDGQKMKITLIVDIFKDALKNNYPFEMNLEMTGFFETENGESDKFIKNAIAILYPYVRALISTYTANANINPLILPAINVNKLIENSEDKKD